MLMKRLIAMGREAGLRVITAWVDAENQGSIAFHENLGFKRAGEMAGIGEKFGRRLGVTILTLDLEEGDGR
jgi:phosphinothricin acetyltransferase